MLPVMRQLTKRGRPPKLHEPPPTAAVLPAMMQLSMRGLAEMEKIPPPSSVEVLPTMVQLTSRGEEPFSQYTPHVLPDTERFKIGGDRLGRGFEVTEIAGDRGLGGKVELRRDLLNTESFVGRLSAYGFYDIGAAWKNDLPGRESAATAGSGVSISGSSLTGYLEVAAPLTGPDIEGKHKASVFAELSYRF